MTKETRTLVVVAEDRGRAFGAAHELRDGLRQHGHLVHISCAARAGGVANHDAVVPGAAVVYPRRARRVRTLTLRALRTLVGASETDELDEIAELASNLQRAVALRGVPHPTTHGREAPRLAAARSSRVRRA